MNKEELKNTIEVVKEVNFEWAAKGNEVKNLPFYLKGLVDYDEYNPFSAFLRTIPAPSKLRIKVILEVI